MKGQRALSSFPTFETDEAAEDFVDTADLSTFDFTGFRPMQIEVDDDRTPLNLRLPTSLVAALREKARVKGVPITSYILMLMEQDVGSR